ncbi:ABC transporter permease [Pseudoalteromonas fuliginea]|uniref:FtsX-like permease family protein n=1 Tax=Pseudoalteromonas fuliginea TaxID=1872678 RepID=A0ABQ6RLI6_9GAMM|nr:ABC transporter permease [Pseudoalteromonas fuliginea]KAA1163358.1 FtsX-like permease family protein [Pseudoalteromonas fuliginea]KAA1168643.1 FtsX-like permease family protein [Pseudoalteromonas fuliginea]
MLKTAYKTFKRAKQYYFTTVFTLALTLSMVISSFSLVDLVFFSPLPYQQSNNLYLLEGTINSKGYSGPASNSKVMSYIQDENTIFTDVATYHKWTDYKLLDQPNRPEIDVILTSHNLFDLLGVKPLRGRLFNKAESLGTKQMSVILGYRAWQNHYNSDPNIIGKKIQLNQRRFTVIGVAPDDLVLPTYSNINDAIWLPIDADETFNPKTSNGFMGAYKSVVRFKPAISDQEISKQLSELSLKGAQLHAPNILKDFTVNARVIAFSEALKGDSGKVVLMLLLGVCLLMLIALINLSSMQLAKAITRIKPLAISFAFGASKKQLIIETLKHNILLISIAVLLALTLTQIGFMVIQNLAADAIQRLDTLSLSINTMLFSVFLIVSIASLYSFIELSVVKERNLMDSLQSSGKGTGKQMSSATSHLLVGLQILFSFLVLTTASHVVLVTLSEALRDNGINTQGKYSLTINYSNIDKSAERINLHKAISQKLLALNNVSSLAVSSEMRLPKTVNVNQIYNEAGQYIAQARNSLVTSNYFTELNLTITGKGFAKGDEELENPPIIINQRLASLLNKNNSEVLNSKVSFDNKSYFSIIGIVSNTYVPGSPESENYEVFTPKDYPGWRQFSYLLTVSNESVAFSQIQQTVIDTDKRLDINDLTSLTAQFNEKRQRHLNAAWLAIVLASTSLLMVCIGVNGIVSYLVKVRRYSLGVKLAMGADNRRLLKESLFELMQPITMSLVLAFSTAFLIIGYCMSLPSIDLPINWWLTLTIWLGLFILAIIASFFPISQTLRQDPIKALRNE